MVVQSVKTPEAHILMVVVVVRSLLVGQEVYPLQHHKDLTHQMVVNLLVVTLTKVLVAVLVTMVVVAVLMAVRDLAMVEVDLVISQNQDYQAM